MTTARVAATKCKGGARHWFTYYGWVGSSAPTCRRCGAPNPNYRPQDDVADHIARMFPPKEKA